MATPEDIATARLLIADLDTANQLFTDSQVASFVDLEEGDVKLAAATALDAIASSEVLVAKKIKTQDLTTDGPAVAKELRAHAALLRQQAYDGTEGHFEVVDFDPSPGPELASWWP